MATLDTRIQFTKSRLYDAMTELLGKKAIGFITIKELCEAAGLNRGTFYLHYSAPMDVLRELQEELLGGGMLEFSGGENVLAEKLSGSVRLIRNNTAEMEIPFTHGYTGAPLYGPQTPADYGQHRGVGAAEMAWSMICDRPHRASAELGLHTMELLCGLDKSSKEGAVYSMTTSFELPRALEPGHTDLILGGVRGGAEASLAK